ncbi:MAG: 1,4-alpha-glucan branching enzyme [Granulosicoccus sp.]|jgi:1,4-alpha-glucan branching enzyme
MANFADLTHGNCAVPFEMLGPKQVKTKTSVNLWIPEAKTATLYCAKHKKKLVQLQLNSAGLFVGEFKTPKETDFVYEVLAEYAAGEHRFIDPYQFQSEAYHAVHFVDHQPENLYQQIGAQLTDINGLKGVRFAVFAPNASAVSLIGDFNIWNRLSHPMQKTSLGYWVLFVPGLSSGEQYKYSIKDNTGHQLPDKADPVGFHHKQYPSHCSVVYDQDAYEWQDAQWLSRTDINHYQTPMSIYEVHLGSWKKPGDSNQRYLSYQELANELVGYVKDMGYTHIEVLPVSEFPFDGSWGYQPVGLFAPTSRFGDPDSFKFFVDICHQNGISVIVDWVPAHFPADGHGLALFDGSSLYEYEDPRKGWHPDWNSCIYDFGKQSVRNFLVSNALFWFDKYHVDGIRVDAVASMLYLDYSRNDGEWIPNVDGGNHNYEAVSLLQWMNTEVYAKHPQAMTIAEESTSYAGVSKPVDAGGLGFGFKWNMGWMHDSLDYIAKDPAYRRFHHGELTFSMVYAFDENFILPISHDEVVHGKGAMLQKMPGDEWQKAANLRAYYGFMFAHPGKKLQFMGNDFAQDREWNHDISLDWHLLEEPKHKGISALYRTLNQVYQNTPALFECDHNPAGFRWIDHTNEEQSVFSLLRRNMNNTEQVIAVGNFTPIPRDEFRIGVEQMGEYELILNTDDADFGGSNYRATNESIVGSEAQPWNECPNSIVVTLPPLSVLMLKWKQS